VPDPAFPEWGRLDPVRVRQVLTNLIGNAIKFTTEGSVTVQTEALLVAHDEQTVMLRVSITDTGIGFDPSRTEALFSPFTQADGSVTRSFGGTGLGLAITRSLVQLMGGDVTAQGHPGQGACFVVNFPMEKATRELAHLMAQADVPLPVMPQSEVSPLKVLLVEDHDINRKLAEIMLQRMGCHYATAQDGQEALDRMAGEHFDVVLMDVMMPVMDGITALGHLREREAATGQHSVVLMVTAHAMTGDRERFLAAGADGYVSKPMSQTALQAEIDRVLAQRAAHASADAP
jgi:CheY-like chemotaxis protein/anti-sigma regulatory factor (Ser/Thr protein kinase)